jgi:glutaredoxin
MYYFLAKCKPCNLVFSYLLAISVAFDSVTYDIREEDRKAIVQFSVQTGEITTPLTLK